MLTKFDFIVVGSGCSGVQSAQTLLEDGAKVLMLDVGIQADPNSLIIPNKDFISIRENEENQSEYFLGKHLGGVERSWLKNKNRLTPLLKFVEKTAAGNIPLGGLWKDSFLESHAQGGLGNSLGRGVFAFSPDEAKKVGIDFKLLKQGYEKIASRVGVFGKSKISLGELNGLENPLALDRSMAKVWSKFYNKKMQWNSKGVFLERTPLAICPKEFGDNNNYNDMDFWSLENTQGYHPGMTLKKLRGYKKFHYQGNTLVDSYIEKEDSVEVRFTNTLTNELETLTCKKIIICASVLGTARIVLKSNEAYDHKLPFISNPFFYTSWINTSMLGQSNSVMRSSFSQLSLYFKLREREDFSLMNLYTYRSLLLHKLIREVPFNFRFSYQLINILKEALVFGGVHLPEFRQEENGVQLVRDSNNNSGFQLNIDYKQDHKRIKENLSFLKRKMLSLGCMPLFSKMVNPGSSKHYGGTLPISKIPKPFTLSSSGRLHGTKNVYVGDASGFNFLPAKGLTFTIMAASHLVALNAVKKHRYKTNVQLRAKLCN
ncbi:MAG: GMC oxidoreductase [Saprospiraceae bacterium]